MIAFVAGLVPPIAAAWMWLRFVRSPAVRAGAAMAFGVAGSSVTFFLWRAAGGGTSAYPIVDVAFWAGLAVVGGLAGRHRVPALRTSTSRGALICGAAGFAVGVPALALATRWVLANPYGRWDAWAIWNLHAKFLAAPSAGWRGMFDPALAWSQRDYPLLLPAAVARGWVFAGRTTTGVPIAIALGLTIATLTILTGSLYRARGGAVAAIGLALAAAPTFVMYGAAQLADVPLGLFAVLAVALLADEPSTPAHLVFAGAALGCAAWTKNEGAVVAASLPALYALVRWRRHHAGAVWRDVTALTLGLSPMLLVLAAFKLLLSPGNLLVDGIMRTRGLASWLDRERLSFVAHAMMRDTVGWGGWALSGPTWLAALVVVAPRPSGPRREPIVLAAGLCLLVQVVAFFAVYVMTPFNVAWHEQTTWARLVTAMWPTVVWWVCATRTGDRLDPVTSTGR